MGIWSYIDFDVILTATVLVIALYFIFTSKRKKYKFIGLTRVGDVRRKRRHSGEKKVYKHQEKCREIFEKLLGVKFNTARPDFLRNPVTGKNLELDGYNEKLKLAFEYDGEQHSKYNSYFHRNGTKEFVYQNKKDTFKDLKCKEHKVVLIRIPHFVAYHDLERYIREQLNTHKLL